MVHNNFYAFAVAFAPFPLRFVAHRAFCASLTRLRAAADMRRRRRGLATSISRALAGIAGLAADPKGRCRNAFRSSAIFGFQFFDTGFSAFSCKFHEPRGMFRHVVVVFDVDGSMNPFAALLVGTFDF
jgi:uncharacterized protein with von Willebrand factor type A (vWA) domain